MRHRRDEATIKRRIISFKLDLFMNTHTHTFFFLEREGNPFYALSGFNFTIFAPFLSLLFIQFYSSSFLLALKWLKSDSLKIKTCKLSFCVCETLFSLWNALSFLPFKVNEILQFSVQFSLECCDVELKSELVEVSAKVIKIFSFELWSCIFQRNNEKIIFKG